MARPLSIAILSLLVATPAEAQTMNAETFHHRASKLKAKGAMAMFSMGEVKTLMREGQAAGAASAAQHRADKKAGRPLRFCPPTGPANMGSDEYMTRLSAIPQAERRKINMTEATTRIMAAKYPCKR